MNQIDLNLNTGGDYSNQRLPLSLGYEGRGEQSIAVTGHLLHPKYLVWSRSTVVAQSLRIRAPETYKMIDKTPSKILTIQDFYTGQIGWTISADCAINYF